MVRPAIAAFLLAALPAAVSCQSTYYSAMERMGVHKREILVERVESARDRQEEAKVEFSSALDAFTALVAVQPSELRERYDALSGRLERCERAATEVTDRIDAVENVALALFAEWEDELDDFSSESMRSASETQLGQTRARYDQLITAMRRAEGRMDPVLVAFRDQVLFLKHNLNAQAIASLQDEFTVLENDIAVLIAEMESAIAEASTFIDSMSAT